MESLNGNLTSWWKRWQGKDTSYEQKDESGSNNIPYCVDVEYNRIQFYNSNDESPVNTYELA